MAIEWRKNGDKMATKWPTNCEKKTEKKERKTLKRFDKMVIKMATIWRQNGDKMAIKKATKSR